LITKGFEEFQWFLLFFRVHGIQVVAEAAGLHGFIREGLVAQETHWQLLVIGGFHETEGQVICRVLAALLLLGRHPQLSMQGLFLGEKFKKGLL
jgi:hypothetical protein